MGIYSKEVELALAKLDESLEGMPFAAHGAAVSAVVAGLVFQVCQRYHREPANGWADRISNSVRATVDNELVRVGIAGDEYPSDIVN